MSFLLSWLSNRYAQVRLVLSNKQTNHPLQNTPPCYTVAFGSLARLLEYLCVLFFRSETQARSWDSTTHFSLHFRHHNKRRISSLLSSSLRAETPSRMKLPFLGRHFPPNHMYVEWWGLSPPFRCEKEQTYLEMTKTSRNSGNKIGLRNTSILWNTWILRHSI